MAMPDRMNRCNVFSLFFLCVIAFGAASVTADYSGFSPRNRRQTENSDPEAYCILPAQPKNGYWKVLGDENAFPNETAVVNQVLQFECSNDYKLLGDRFVICLKTGWSSSKLPTCGSKICPPLHSTKVTKIKCLDKNRREVNCSEAADGDSATITCDPYYEATSKGKIHCYEGTWDLPPPVCVPVCGEKKVSAVPLIINASSREKGSYPWVTEIFIRRDNDRFDQVCGGTMISPKLIITAAHCVTYYNNSVMPVEDVKVAVGKYYRTYNDHRDIEAQYGSLEKIIVHPKYRGEILRYSSNIAVLVTKRAFLISKAVQPVCFRNLQSLKLAEGAIGVVTGWGYTTPNGNSSEELRELEVSYKSEEICFEELPSNFAQYLTNDKMCAGRKGRAPCRGDSGGGLVFKNERDNRYYIHGVLSSGSWTPPNGCDTEVSSLYMKVAFFYDWLEEIVVKYSGNLFTCANGSSVDKTCDRKKDCGDNPDEGNCITSEKTEKVNSNCKSDQFQCNSGQCIFKDEKCNGITDCKDQSDETKETCLNIFCPDWTYKCDYGACVDEFAKCNGVKDCVDNSDELYCPPIKTNTTKPGPVKPTKAPPTVKPDTSGPCVLPEHPENGQWHLLGGVAVYPGDRIGVNSVLEFECNKNYTLSSEKYVACQDSGWSLQKMPTCLLLCPPLYTTQVTNIRCVDKNKIEIKCSDATDGAAASFSCAPYYESADRTRTNRYCWNGSWNLPPTICQPVCGQKKVSADPLIVNGKTVEKGDYPWVTAIFHKDGKVYTNVCGGSMITQRIILTVAHCVTDTYGTPFPAEKIEVGVGKYYRQYKDPRDTQAQYSKVDKVLVPIKYKADAQHFSSDIALLVTNDILLLSKVVQPVCYLDVPNQILDTGLVGVVTGWGYTVAGGNPSDELKEVDVPYKPDSTCYQELPSDWVDKYLTFDKMCAGHYNRSITVCEGDSGGGLVFKNYRDNRFYVHGIVSLSKKVNNVGCDIQVSALYTKVASHFDWLEPLISRYIQV